MVTNKQTLKRLPVYLSLLKSLGQENDKRISSTKIAEALSLNDVQVRKDLAAVCFSGKPKTGYVVADLIKNIESFLGYDNTDTAILAGCGKLGKALLNYEGFKEYGLDILFAFDTNETAIDNKKVLHISKVKEMCQRVHPHIGIITVPPSSAQQICDIFVDVGIKAIWNFSPVHLVVPNGVLVQNENMAASLALLSQHLKQNFSI